MFSVSHRYLAIIVLPQRNKAFLYCGQAQQLHTRGAYKTSQPPQAYWQVEAALILGTQFDTDLAVDCIYTNPMWFPKLRREYIYCSWKSMLLSRSKL